MSISDEEIIAYLLGDADQALAHRIGQLLPVDQELAERVVHFRALLWHLDQSNQRFEAPAGLIDKTLTRIPVSPAHAEPTELASQSPLSPVAAGASSSSGQTSTFSLPVSLSSAICDHWLFKNLTDSVALTVSLILLCSLILPAILRARFEARKLHCAENLRTTGVALIQFAITNPDQRFPALASRGPESFAGVYTIRLNTAGLLDSIRQVQCAGVVGIRQPQVIELTLLPTLEQLHQANQAQLKYWQQMAGGDYAYNLGINEQRRLVAPRNDGRSHFAILSDAPIFANGTENLISHDGRGANVFYDDGHVSFVSSRLLNQSQASTDHPFRNRHNLHAAGLDNLDAALAPSVFPPLAE
jgi:hypothetical protein